MRTIHFAWCLIILAIFVSTPPASAAVKGQMVFSNSSAIGWEAGLVWRPSVIYNGSFFMMWYSGETSVKQVDNIGLATSADGIHWSRYAGNPVLSIGSGGEWDRDSVNEPWVIYDGGQYKMWYTGQTYNPAGTEIQEQSIGYATSSDGIHWTKFSGNPVLAKGAAGSWDDKWVGRPIVLSQASGYVMWHGGSTKDEYNMGMATSSDGIHWTRTGTITITKGSWDSWQDFLGGVMKSGDVYVASYWGRPSENGRNQIGFATSTDGISWTPYSGNPVITYGSGGWDGGGIWIPMTIIVGQSYYVYYSAWALDQRTRNVGLVILPMSQYPIPEYQFVEPVVVFSFVALVGSLALRRRFSKG